MYVGQRRAERFVPLTFHLCVALVCVHGAASARPLLSLHQCVGQAHVATGLPRNLWLLPPLFCDRDKTSLCRFPKVLNDKDALGAQEMFGTFDQLARIERFPVDFQHFLESVHHLQIEPFTCPIVSQKEKLTDRASSHWDAFAHSAEGKLVSMSPRCTTILPCSQTQSISSARTASELLGKCHGNSPSSSVRVGFFSLHRQARIQWTRYCTQSHT